MSSVLSLVTGNTEFRRHFANLDPGGCERISGGLQLKAGQVSSPIHQTGVLNNYQTVDKRVNKRLTILFLMLCASNVRAEWQPIGFSSDGNRRHFIEPTSKQSGPRPMVWAITDYKVPQHGNVASVKIRYEANCAGAVIRIVSFVAYDGHMGRGRVLSSADTTTAWSDFPPGSSYEVIFDFLCSRK